MRFTPVAGTSGIGVMALVVVCGLSVLDTLRSQLPDFSSRLEMTSTRRPSSIIQQQQQQQRHQVNNNNSFIASLSEKNKTKLERIRNTTTTTTTSDGTTSTSVKKPLFVLHVGPHKTGTTALQCAMSQSYIEQEEAWHKDNFVYLGGYDCRRREEDGKPAFGIPAPSRIFPEIIVTFKSPGFPFYAPRLVQRKGKSSTIIQEDPTHEFDKNASIINPTFVKSLEQVHGYNVIYSDEYLSVLNAQQITIIKQLLDPHWNVQVLVSYRRLFDWLPSHHAQNSKHLGMPQSWDSEWPGEGGGRGRHVFDISLRDALAANTDATNHTETILAARWFESFETHHVHPSEVVYNNYRFYFHDVQMISAHHLNKTTSYGGGGGDPFLHHMFCNGVLSGVDTTNLCHIASKMNVNLQDNKSEKEAFWFDMLAIKAYQLGMLSSSANNNKNNNNTPALSRIQVARIAKKHYDKEVKKKRGKGTIAALPETCLSQEKLQRLKTLSWQLEDKLVRQQQQPKQMDHDQSFNRSVNHGKFCNLDADKALQLPFWKSFFSQL